MVSAGSGTGGVGPAGGDGDAPRADRPRRRRWALPLFSLALVAAGVANYVNSLDPKRGEILLAPLVVRPEAKTLDALDVAPGALAGQNLVLITLDTTRPDRLGCYGLREAATPNIDELAASGVIFSNAIATAPTTVPAHASIFTGRYPWNHGARVNGTFTLDGEVSTLAEVLSAHGYETAAFISAFVLDARFGLDRGFEVYDDDLPESTHFGDKRRRRGDATTASARRWLAGRGRAPFFLWVHYYDPHAPYDPPPPFDAFPNYYDGALAFVDVQVGALLAAVERVGSETLVVLTADHGEGLGVQGEPTHGFLVQEATLRVPLILQADSGLPRAAHVSERVSEIDLLPSILSLLGLPLPDGLDGVDLTRGPIPSRALAAETLEGNRSFGWARLTAIYRDSLKYIDGPNPELYDFASDPLERRNVLASRPSDARELKRLLAEKFAAVSERVPESRLELTGEEAAQLQALGYFRSAGDHTDAGPQANAALPDPKAQMPLWNEVQDVLSDRSFYYRMPTWMRVLLMLKGRTFPSSTAETIVALEQMAIDHPDFVPIQRFLESLYWQENRFEESRRAAERATKLLDRSASRSRPGDRG